MGNEVALKDVKEITVDVINSQIIRLPNREPAMLSNSLAAIYGTEVENINRAVKRNPERFPSDFYFQATDSETEWIKKNIDISLLIIEDNQNARVTDLRCNFASQICNSDNEQEANNTQSIISNKSRFNPYLFTREGVNMLCTVINSKAAAERSVQIIRVFSQLERRFDELVNKPPQFFLSQHDLDLSLEEEVRVFQQCLNKFNKKMTELQDSNKGVKLLEKQPCELKYNYDSQYYRIEDIDWLVKFFDLTQKGLYQAIEDQLLKESRKTKYPPRFFDKNSDTKFFRIDAVLNLRDNLKNKPTLMKKFRSKLYEEIK